MPSAPSCSDAAGRRALLRVLGASRASRTSSCGIRSSSAPLASRRRAAHARRSTRALLEAVASRRRRAARPAWIALRVRYRRMLARLAAYDLEQPDARRSSTGVGGAARGPGAGAALEASLRRSRAPAAAGFPRERGRRDAARDHRHGQDRRARAELRQRRRRDLRRRGRAASLGDRDAVDIATRLAVQTMRGISELAIEPPLWEVDANLRPEGKQGALVRTLDSHLSYYDRWAKSWEFQALLKARPIAGDRTRRGLRARACARDLDERGARELRRQRAAHARAGDRAHPGGRRRRTSSSSGRAASATSSSRSSCCSSCTGCPMTEIRQRGTLDALRRARRARLHRPRRGRRVLARLPRAAPARASVAAAAPAAHAPDASRPEDLRVLARASGLADTGERSSSDWERVKREVRDPPCAALLPAAAVRRRRPARRGATRCTSEQAEARLAAIGFGDPRGALRHIAALTSGLSRRAKIQRT